MDKKSILYKIVNANGATLQMSKPPLRILLYLFSTENNDNEKIINPMIRVTVGMRWEISERFACSFTSLSSVTK